MASNPLRRLKQLPSWIAPFGIGAAFGGIVIGSAVGFSFGYSRDIAVALMTLVGVVLGGGISAATSVLLTHRETQAQLVLSTWPKRVEAHHEAFFSVGKCLKALRCSHVERKKFLHEMALWHGKNCLYFSDDLNTALSRMLQCVEKYDEKVETHKDGVDIDDERAHTQKQIEDMQIPHRIVNSSGFHIADEIVTSLLPDTKYDVSSISGP